MSEDPDSPAALAEVYADGARTNFEREGSLSPIVAFHAPKRVVICSCMGETEDQPAQFGGVALVMAGLLKPDVIITIAEVWKREFAVDEVDERRGVRQWVDPNKIQRGDLGRMAASGDSSVRTALMTAAWTLDPRHTHTILDTVVSQPPRDEGGGWQGVKGRDPVAAAVEYERVAMTGDQEGHMAEMVISGWQKSMEVLPPEGYSVPELIALAGKVGLIGSASVQEWE